MPAKHQPALLLITAAAGLGILAATRLLPAWLPAIQASLAGSSPQAFWYLSRSSALVSYFLLWLSMCLGLMITNKLARLWPGGPNAFDLHQYTSLFGLALGSFHGLILLGDRFLKARFWQILVPFGLSSYQPFWVGLGQLAFYLMAIVTISFYVRKQLSRQTWRAIHFLSFASFLLVLIHGLSSGSDSGTAWFQTMYWGTGGVFLFLLIYRLLASWIKPAQARPTS
jgi:predicted ferric reductase